MQNIVDNVYNELKAAVEQTADKPCAIAYSGGLDSSLLLALSGYRYIPYTLGFSDSRDIENVDDASTILKINPKIILLDEIDIEGYISQLLKIDPKITKMEMGYELVLFILMDFIPEKYVVTGQGADELFYGYRRFIDNPRLKNDTYINRLFNVTLPREKKMAEYYDKELITPYLSLGMLKIRHYITREDNIEGNRNKLILREIAAKTSLPEEIYNRSKTAAQYGSGINKYLLRQSDKIFRNE
ncbi:asparagine synthase C-terminal domain-containing protein [Ferroplasma acidiphilum]|uniref:asparagine synthase C-terminal domain-containing protein n=1 Tax=Ferroplasma acidiphilum TaxID=74969 RepID=UPI0023F3F5D5|nr:asparagine synthase-related protein [Ferroplasma acidiphilum]